MCFNIVAGILGKGEH